MKKLLIGFMTLLMMVSCDGNGNKDRQSDNVSPVSDDSVTLNDSEGKPEKAENNEWKVNETLASDSIKEESTDKRAEALALIPSFNEFEKNSDKGSFFKKRGFKVKEKYVINDGDLGNYTEIVAVLNAGDGITCKFENSYGGGGGFSITIDGAPEKLKEIYNKAKSFVSKRNKRYRDDGSEEFGEVTLRKNTVEIVYYNIGS